MQKLSMTYINTNNDKTKLLYNNNEGGRKPVQFSSKLNRDSIGDKVIVSLKG